MHYFFAFAVLGAFGFFGFGPWYMVNLQGLPMGSVVVVGGFVGVEGREAVAAAAAAALATCITAAAATATAAEAGRSLGLISTG